MIATKVKESMCLVSLKFFIVRSMLCATVQTYTTYKTIITIITIHLLFFSAYNIFVSNTVISYSSHTTIRYSAHNLFVSANLYTLDLRNLVLTQSPFIYTRLQSAEPSQIGRFMISFFR